VRKAPCLGDPMRRIRISSVPREPRVCSSRVFPLFSSGLDFCFCRFRAGNGGVQLTGEESEEVKGAGGAGNRAVRSRLDRSDERSPLRGFGRAWRRVIE
jgi:hypothetical protein